MLRLLLIAVFAALVSPLPRLCAAVLPQMVERRAGKILLMGSASAHYQCIKVFSETDQTKDLKEIDVPVLVMHGDDDQVVPIANSADKAVKLLKKGTLKVYKVLSHGFFATHPDQVNADLLAFIKT